MRFAGLMLCLAVANSSIARPTGFVETTIALNAPPVGLAFDTEGNLFALEAADFGSNEARLRRVLPNGTVDGSFPLVGDDGDNFFVGSMTYDPIGERLLVTDNTADGRLYAIDTTGNQTTVATGIAGIAGVVVRSTGEIFVSTSPFGQPGEVLQVERSNGSTSIAWSGLGYGAGLAFDLEGNLIIQDADTVTFQGRLQRLPMMQGVGGLEIGTPMTILSGMQSGAGVTVDSEGGIFATGNGGLYRVDEAAPAELPFDNNGNSFQFATAIAFDSGTQPFEPFRGLGGGRLAYLADFGFSNQDSFITLLTPAQPGDYDGNGDVNGDDYLAWQHTFGSASELSADGNLDGIVSAADYVLWRKFASAGNIGSTQSVPEPTSVGFVAVILGMMEFVRRRQRPWSLPFAGLGGCLPTRARL